VNNDWYTSTSNPNVTWDFSEAKRFDSIEFSTYLDAGDHRPSNISILVSDDGSSWTEVYSNDYINESISLLGYGIINFTAQNKRYLRLNIIDDSAGNGIVASEIRIWESSSIQYNHNFTSLADANYKYNVTIYDDADNVNSTGTRDVSILVDASGVGSCAQLNVAGQVYTLDENVSSTGTCFNVTAENVTIDCAGNTTVRGCVVREGSEVTGDKHGVYFKGDNGTYFNNTFRGLASSYGIHLYGSDFANVTNNSFFSYHYGIRIALGSDNIVNNNYIETQGSSDHGFDIIRSPRNSIDGLTIYAPFSGAKAMIIDDDSPNTTIRNFNFTSFFDALNVEDDIVQVILIDGYIKILGNGKDMDLGATTTDAGSYVKTINVTFNKSNVAITDPDIYLEVMWYLDIHVNDTAGLNINNANVTISNNTGYLIWSEQTNSSGDMPTRLNLTEYTQNYTGEENKTYQTNYSIFTSVTNYLDKNESLNVTVSTYYNVVLSSASFDRSALGLTTNKRTVNHNEDVNLTITIPVANLGGNTLDTVWAEILMPNSSRVNVSLVNLVEPIYDENTILWMHFDNDSSYGENDTYVYDFSEMGNNGTVSGAVPITDGKTSGGFEFDGDGDEIFIPSSDSFGLFDNLTVSLWFKISTAVSNNVFLNAISSMYIRTGINASTLVAGHADLNDSLTLAIGLTAFNDSQWHHVAWTWSNGSSIIYFDGSAVVEEYPYGQINCSGDNLRIGDGPYIGEIDFNGSLDELVIYNTTLSADEVISLYNSSKHYNYTYTNTGVLGYYNVSFNANLTTGSVLFEDVRSNFSVENTSISIDVGSEANTTQVINVNGVIQTYNGSDYEDVVNNLFLIKLNNVTVSSDIYNDSDFVSGGGASGGENVNMSDVLQLNLTTEGSVMNYSDDYGTNGYENDVNDSYNEGFVSGRVFDDENMPSGNVGNLTYKFTSITKFYNASAYVETQTAGEGSDGGGNTSVWFSLNASSWNILESSTTQGAWVGGYFDVQDAGEFFVKIESDISSGENPVDDLQINYTHYDYPSIGDFNSTTINLVNVTYTVLKWQENLSGGDIKIQLRESDDGSTWDVWSANYTNNLDNDISSFSKNYLQYRAWLETSNVSRTPVLYEVNISYFNASTNSTGGYNYNVTMPSDNLGVLPLEVSVVNNPTTGIVGSNETNITVWAETVSQYATAKDYSLGESKYSVYVNFTRSDTGALVNGSVNVSISKGADLWSQSGVTGCVGFCEINESSETGLVGLWHVNNDSSYGENDTHVYDFSGGGNNGTVTDAVWTSSGKLGAGAFEFDGISGEIDTGGDMIDVGSDSVCAWIYPKGWGESNVGTIFTNNKFLLRLWNDNTLKVSSDGIVSATSGTDIVLDTWQHVCAIRNSSGYTIFYIDGSQSDGSDPESGTPASGTTNLIIGNRGAGDRTFNGTIDEVAIWNRSLSAIEIEDLYLKKGQFVASWNIPSELGYGNYTINISVWNETAWYVNSTTGYYDYLEQKNTTGTLNVENKTIGDYSYGNEYSFLWNATINNTGNASMNTVYVYDYEAVRGDAIKNITELVSCTKIWPETECNVTLNITLVSDASPDDDPGYRISWRANWTDNDDGLSGGIADGYIAFTNMYVKIVGNASLALNNYSVNLSIEHESFKNFTFAVQSIGSDTVYTVNTSLLVGNITADSNNLSSDWVSVATTNPIVSIAPNTESNVTVNISIPAQTAPGNYSGRINVSATIGGEKLIDLIVTVPSNGSWYFSPATNFSYNNSFSLNTEGEIGNFSIVNIGNINLTMNLSYDDSGSFDYHGLGEDLFKVNYNAGGLITNPTSANVTKGENTTVTLFHQGDSTPRADVGIIMKVYNTSADPDTFYIEDSFTIEEQAPNVTDIWFIYENNYGTVAEQNANVTIKVRATDDIALNETAGVLNISWSGGATQVNLSSLSSIAGEFEGGPSYTQLNYSVNYTPTTGGAGGAVYNVIATVYDKGTPQKLYITDEYNFTSYGTTTMELSQNYSSISLSDVDIDTNGVAYVNYTINNTGNVRAYAPTLNFTMNESVVITNYTFSDLTANSTAEKVIQMDVSALTGEGEYNVTAILSWTNPNTGTATDSVVFTINVGENKSMSKLPTTISTSLNSGTTNTSILEINNTGNALLSSMNLDCYTGTLCSALTVLFNESNFNISVNKSVFVNVSLTAGLTVTADTYLGTINISESEISDTVDIQAVVPETKTWTISYTSLNVTKGAETSGDLQQVMLNNTGNINMTFNFASANATLFDVNESSLMVALASVSYFMVNYSAPTAEGEYVIMINITNTDGGADPVKRNITVNMTVTSMGIDILSPTGVSPLTNVNASDLIEIHTNLTYAGSALTSNTTWNVTIGRGVCTSLSSSHTGVYWNITCNAPSIADGFGYNLTTTATHTTYGERSDTEDAAIFYLDITRPGFDVTRNHVNLGSNINLQVNVTDNVGVDTVWAYLTYPNSSVINFSLSLSGGLYINNSFALNVGGEYSVNYTANDTIGNFNSTTDWFEVYDNYNWNIKLRDYNASAVADVNVSLYRPGSVFLMSNATNSSGGAVLSVNRRFYDIHTTISKDEIDINNVNFSNLSENNVSFNLHRIDGEDLGEAISLYKPFMGVATNSTGFDSNVVSAIFNYTGYNYANPLELGVVKCSAWNYTGRACSGSWSVVSSSRDIDAKKVTGNSSGFNSVAYFLAENKCGNGACETTYGETTSTCSDDCVVSTITTVTSGGGGGGGGGISTAQLKRIEDIVKSFLNIGGVRLETTSIYKEMFAGETTTVRIRLKNTLSSATVISLSAIGDVDDMLFFDSSEVSLEGKEERDVLIKIVAPKLIDPGNYDGDLVLTSKEKEGKIPVTIRILSPEGKLLDVKIQPLTPTVRPGGILRLQTDLMNLGKTKRVDVQFDLQLLHPETGEILTRAEEAFAVETTISTVKNLTIPEEIKPGRYMVKATAYYSNIEQSMQASSIAYVKVQEPFFLRSIFGIPVWIFFVIFLLGVIVAGGFSYVRYLTYQKKRFKIKVDMQKLPRASEHAGFVGKVAETGVRAFIDLNKLTMHTLVAGSTGSGKTIAAQSIIEEALVHNKSVIVFDPTAQWTGFLRKCVDKGMLKRYKYFNMKAKDARAFNGSIKTIHDPYELINLKKYMNRPGEITVFNVSNLTPKEIDVVVASTIEQVFKSQPEESRTLKTLIVYDEVHRLLPKFGGSGQGFVQLERGAREFRKWGIGLVLISQVLSDFIGEIKANIGTEAQMGTRYEGDLERVSMKYGEDILKSVVKEPIGTGMVVNAEYNSGRPYFIAFRPILHTVKRLTRAELVKYEKYFEELEDLEFQTAYLKKLKVDVLDLELEMKLAKSKIKEGSFQMADMYLETLRPKFVEQWKKLGKAPVHRIKKKISRAEVVKAISKARAERVKYAKKMPAEKISFDQELLDLKKKIEEEKKKGKVTSQVEAKLEDLKRRLKPFKGKVNQKDAEGIKQEVATLKKEVSKLSAVKPIVRDVVGVKPGAKPVKVEAKGKVVKPAGAVKPASVVKPAGVVKSATKNIQPKPKQDLKRSKPLRK